METQRSTNFPLELNVPRSRRRSAPHSLPQPSFSTHAAAIKKHPPPAAANNKMPKHDFFAQSDINRIKAKGLQKLRWYCEMCQKQCRDENGFKCHQTSDSHLRQMRIFAENPGAVMHGYSSEFEKNFLDSLSRRHGTKELRQCSLSRIYRGQAPCPHERDEMGDAHELRKYLGKPGQCGR